MGMYDLWTTFVASFDQNADQSSDLMRMVGINTQRAITTQNKKGQLAMYRYLPPAGGS